MVTPKRVQLSRRAGWRMPSGAVKVDRSTAWGNPYTFGSRRRVKHFHHVRDRAESVRKFRALVDRSPALRERIVRELGGKDLACWCGPDQECHADVLLEVANGGRR